MRRSGALIVGLLMLAACDGGPPVVHNDQDDVGPFPAADRPVARIISPRWSTEEARDRLNEAGTVMNKAGIAKGMTVADIGAGEGYYTIRLASRVGKDGRVLAEDIVPEVRDALAERVARDRLDNVSVRLGEPANPKLPDNSFDRILMVHMYHEIEQPYEFLWRMRPSLKPMARWSWSTPIAARRITARRPNCSNANSLRSATSWFRSTTCRRRAGIWRVSRRSGRDPNPRTSAPAAWCRRRRRRLLPDDIQLIRAPAKAGAQGYQGRRLRLWAPAFAGARQPAAFSTTQRPARLGVAHCA